LRLRKIISDICLVIFILAYLVFYLYPTIPRSIAGWFVLIFLGVPALIFIETTGEKILGSNFFKNRTGSIRIILVVPVVLLIGTVAIGIITFVYQSIGYVGG